MFLRPTNLIRRCFCRPLACRGLATAAEQNEAERDPAPFFFSRNVQRALKKLTRVDYDKVLRPRKLRQKIIPYEYRFMTDEELEKAIEKSTHFANKILQIPPVVKEKKNDTRILSEDYALEGLNTCNIIFTDVSLGSRNKDRLIVVREPSGVLRTANIDETHRMNQIYFSRKGRELEAPRMFKGEHLINLLERGEYEFVLDRTCLQFEPDHPDYHRVTKTVYEHVLATEAFNSLRSTRHFGALVFYLIWNNKIDRLLVELLNDSQIDEAVELVKLFHVIHPNANSASQNWDGNDPAEFIMNYINLDGQDKSALTDSLNKFTFMRREKEKLAAGINRAHGVKQQASDSRDSDSSDSDSSDSDSSESNSKPKNKQ